MQSKSIIRPIVGTGIILLIPLVAMQFTSEVTWDGSDFIVMGLLLLATGVGLEFVMEKFSSSTQQTAAVVAIVVVFLLIWAELAVGIFGTPWAGS